MSAADLPGEVQVLADPLGVAAAAAEWITARSAECDTFRIACAGGSTPTLLYEALASPGFRDRVDWPRWRVFFGDERAVPPDDAASNYRLVRDNLLDRVPISPHHVHRIEAERIDLDAAAAEYSRLLEGEAGDPPRLDVVLLGLGPDGHTASLFPGTDALEVTDAWAVRGRAPMAPEDRITLTLPVLNAAMNVAFLVTGATKADALRAVRAGTVPAARVRPPGDRLHWFLDSVAARSIE